MNLVNIKRRIDAEVELASEATPQDTLRLVKDHLRPPKLRQGPRIPPEIRSVMAIAQAADQGRKK
jgi:hypothetical protein